MMKWMKKRKKNEDDTIRMQNTVEFNKFASIAHPRLWDEILLFIWFSLIFPYILRSKLNSIALEIAIEWFECAVIE